MLKNYIITAIRNFRKSKEYILINMLGFALAIGIAITSYLNFAFNYEFNDTYDAY